MVPPPEVACAEPETLAKPDIEHAFVENDPRKWSTARKTTILIIISAASLIAGLGSNIYNPSIHDIEVALHATNSDISLTLSLFILLQGVVPLLWSSISEIKGRKVVYITSITLYTVGCICVATAKNISVVIGMRCLQALGSSAVIAIGAATLADIYEPHERGTMMGVYYTAPLLGPSIGPILGGGLTQGFDWRASFWFLTIFGGINLISFLFFFRDTFRRERSLTYQLVLKKRIMEREAAMLASKRSSQITVVTPEKVKMEKSSKQEENKGATPDPTAKDVEAQNNAPVPSSMKEIKLSFMDINPIPPIILVLRRWNNIAILTASGLIFAFSYCISYTCSRNLTSIYGYNALQIGLVLLAYGIGAIFGSILGGKFSDWTLARLKAKNGGQSYAEMRLESTKATMVILPLAVVAYGWLVEKHVHIAAVCIALFFCGFSSIWMYSSTLAYIVDANVGRSSTAVACNSMFRGVFAFVATEVAVPLDNAIGEGGFYSLWAGLMLVTEVLLLLVWWKGGQWRESAEAREKAAANRR
ncbi:MFS general substrate transporter [Gloeophyllum trabeum ATCC 11539]|uniref:MFS general substrate transporter n=1 Tax=Gloeophyllum trabeum (strain ATCC 11539 / FP-39264 / Madison 617) TaxID=670483 RepID=S7RPI4_GLOTA|nr:MFS general substrate transporter [Gloeophyllum trabeum ATCC 11539]EPQ54769.1 MFS general substrate transporter [Gloeophyllum trabeum ATCC 11539]